MSTRCLIGISDDLFNAKLPLEPGASFAPIKLIYCHHDGYIESGVGEKLYTNYTSTDAVEQLISLGDISVLGYSADDCYAYSRDRGDPLSDTQAVTVKTYQELEQNVRSTTAEYVYVWDKLSLSWFVLGVGRAFYQLSHKINNF